MDEELILNRYRPLEEAGAGGYGTVVVAWDPRIQRRVAIKQLQIDPDLLPSVADGVYDTSAVPGLEEARTAALLSDPSIVGILDFEVEDNIAYLIMEYVDGCTLTQLMQDYPHEITLDIVGAVFKGVSHALQVAHENQVLHLDIKPDNVLINRQGEVKVTDFGLSRLSHAEGFDKAAGGTIGYMPLEQMRLETLDARCDEWALAALTYEMLTQSNPFAAPDLKAAQAAIEQAECMLPSLTMEGFDEQGDDVLFYGLSPEREDRYDTVADFASELLPFLGNPQTGTRQLARLVGAATEEVEDPDAPPVAVSHLERTGSWKTRTLRRVWAVVNCGVLGAFALSCMQSWIGTYQTPLFWGLLAAVVVAAAVLPHVGAFLAVAAFALALLSQGAYAAGALLLFADALWWFFSGRHTSKSACAALSVVPLGMVGLGAVAPVLCGYLLKVKDAVLSSILACIVALALAGSVEPTLLNWEPLRLWGSTDLATHNSLAFAAVRGLVTNPVLWMDAVSWVIAAAAMAFFCARSNRALGFTGAIVAGAMLLLAAFAHVWIASGGQTLMPPVLDFVRALAPLVVGGVLCLYGVPARDYD